MLIDPARAHNLRLYVTAIQAMPTTILDITTASGFRITHPCDDTFPLVYTSDNLDDATRCDANTYDDSNDAIATLYDYPNNSEARCVITSHDNANDVHRDFVIYSCEPITCELLIGADG